MTEHKCEYCNKLLWPDEMDLENVVVSRELHFNDSLRCYKRAILWVEENVEKINNEEHN